MSEITITRFANRGKPTEYINIEAGSLTVGPIQPGWLNAQWQIEPVSGTSYVRFKNLWNPDKYLHIEGGVPDAGPIEPGRLSAHWQFEPVPGTAFVRIRNRWPLVRYAHIESGQIDVGRVGPGWLSAHWLLEKVQNTSFVRLRNRWKPDQCLNIESGVLSVDSAGPGWLSAQWSVEKVAGTSYVRFKNRWKPDQYFHIESGRTEAGPIGPGWLSAQWLLEKVPGTNFAWLRNRWRVEPYLHIERGVLEVGIVEPGWLSAQWLTGAFRSKVIPLALFQRKFDEFVNNRVTPLFKFRLHGEEYGKSELTIFYEDLLKGTLEQSGEPVDLGHLELPTTGNNFHFNDFNTDRATLNMTSDPAGSTPEIEVRVHFETGGEELKINNAPNIDFDGLNIMLRLPIMLDAINGRVGLHGFVDLVEQAMRTVKVTRSGITVEFRGKVFQKQGSEEFTEALKQDLKKDLFKEFVNADASVDVTGLPDGVVARKIESTLNEKILEALQERLKDQSKPGWIPWTSVSEGRSTPGAPVTAVVTGQDRVTLFLADPNGGIFTTKEGHITRPGINRRLTRLLVGGDYQVVGVWSDGQALTVDYLVGRQLDPFPENPQPPLKPGLLSNIDHIVVLMMENRSFDHMLGYLGKHGGRTDVDGLQDPEPGKPPKKNTYDGDDYFPFPLTETLFKVSPCHGYDCVDRQVNTKESQNRQVREEGAMGGFVKDFAERAKDAASNCINVKPGDIMGYYTAEQVPVYDALAREFLICDHWFCSHPGGTFPNRFYAMTGRLDRDANGNPEVNNPHGDNFAPVFTKTIFDHLTDQGVSWHYYEHGYCFLRLFERYTFDTTNIVDVRDPENGFFAAAQAGTLPSVSFIDPDFIEVPPGNDDHAPADIANGQHLIGKIVHALMKGPLWNKTLLLITYDEHGGFYDHVPPPLAPAVSGIDHYGVRVPTFVISPWVERGTVTNVVFDHTSILKTIARRFLNARPPDMGERMAQANDLSMVLRSTVRQDNPNIPLPPEPVRTTRRFDWELWTDVSEGSSIPGAPITAVVTGKDRVALFAADQNGGIYTTETCTISDTEGDQDFHKLLRSMHFLFFVG